MKLFFSSIVRFAGEMINKLSFDLTVDRGLSFVSMTIYLPLSSLPEVIKNPADAHQCTLLIPLIRQLRL
jgi:hypothetical protein